MLFSMFSLADMELRSIEKIVIRMLVISIVVSPIIFSDYNTIFILYSLFTSNYFLELVYFLLFIDRMSLWMS